MKCRNFGRTVLNTIDAILHGKLLMRLRVDKFFPLIAYCFVLIWLTILLGIFVQGAMSKVEDNRKTLEELKIIHAEKTVELAGFSRISRLEELLKERNSEVRLPEKPADRIRK